MPPTRDQYYLPPIPDELFADWERDQFVEHVKARAESQDFLEHTDDLSAQIPTPKLFGEQAAQIPIHTPAPASDYDYDSDYDFEAPAPEMPPAELPKPPGQAFMDWAGEKIGGVFGQLGAMPPLDTPYTPRQEPNPFLPETQTVESSRYGPIDYTGKAETLPVSQEYEDDNPWKPRETGAERFERTGNPIERIGQLGFDAPVLGGIRDILNADEEYVANERPDIYGGPDERATKRIWKDPATLAILEALPPEERIGAMDSLRRIGAIPGDMVVPQNFDQDPNYRSLRKLTPNISDDRLLELAVQAGERQKRDQERGITARPNPKGIDFSQLSPDELARLDREGALTNEKAASTETPFTGIGDRLDYMERHQDRGQREAQDAFLGVAGGVVSAGLGSASSGTGGVSKAILKGASYLADPTEAGVDAIRASGKLASAAGQIEENPYLKAAAVRTGVGAATGAAMPAEDEDDRIRNIVAGGVLVGGGTLAAQKLVGELTKAGKLEEVLTENHPALDDRVAAVMALKAQAEPESVPDVPQYLRALATVETITPETQRLLDGGLSSEEILEAVASRPEPARLARGLKELAIDLATGVPHATHRDFEHAADASAASIVWGSARPAAHMLRDRAALNGMVEDIAQLMGMSEVPRVQLREGAHAYAEMTKSGPVVVLGDEVLSVLREREVSGMVAHELAHIQEGHLGKRLVSSEDELKDALARGQREMNGDTNPDMYVVKWEYADGWTDGQNASSLEEAREIFRDLQDDESISKVWTQPGKLDADGFPDEDPDADPVMLWHREDPLAKAAILRGQREMNGDTNPDMYVVKWEYADSWTDGKIASSLEEAREIFRDLQDDDSISKVWTQPGKLDADGFPDEDPDADPVMLWHREDPLAKAAETPKKVTTSEDSISGDTIPAPEGVIAARTPDQKDKIERAWKMIATRGEKHEMAEATQLLRAYEEALDDGNRVLADQAWRDFNDAAKDAPRLGTPEAQAIANRQSRLNALTQRGERQAPVEKAPEPDQMEEPYPLDESGGLQLIQDDKLLRKRRWSHKSGLEIVQRDTRTENYRVAFVNPKPKPGENMYQGAQDFDHPPTRGELQPLIEKQVALGDPEEAAKLEIRAKTSTRPESQKPKLGASRPRPAVMTKEEIEAEAQMDRERMLRASGVEPPKPPAKPPTKKQPEPDPAPEGWTPSYVSRGVPHNVARPLGAVPNWAQGTLRRLEAQVADRPLEISDEFIEQEVERLIEQQPQAIRQLAEQIHRAFSGGTEIAMWMKTLKVMALLEIARDGERVTDAGAFRGAMHAADLAENTFVAAAANLGNQIGRAMRQLRGSLTAQEAVRQIDNWDAFADNLEAQLVVLGDLPLKLGSGEALTVEEITGIQRLAGAVEGAVAEGGMLTDAAHGVDELLDARLRGQEDGIAARQILSSRYGDREYLGVRMQFLDEEIARAREAGNPGLAKALEAEYERTVQAARAQAVEQLARDEGRAKLWNKLDESTKDSQIEQRVRKMLGQDHRKTVLAEVKAAASDNPEVIKARQDVADRVARKLEEDRVNEMVARAKALLNGRGDPKTREAFDTLLGEMESYSARGKIQADRLRVTLEKSLSRDAERLREFRMREAERQAIAQTVTKIRSHMRDVVQGKEGALSAFETELRKLDGTPAEKRMQALRAELNKRLDAAEARRIRTEHARQERAILRAEQKAYNEEARATAREGQRALREAQAQRKADTKEVLEAELKRVNERARAIIQRERAVARDAIERLAKSPRDGAARAQFDRAVANIKMESPRIAAELHGSLVNAMARAAERDRSRVARAMTRGQVRKLYAEVSEVLRAIQRGDAPEGTGAKLDSLLDKLRAHSQVGRQRADELRDRLVKSGIAQYAEKVSKDDSFLATFRQRLAGIDPTKPEDVLQLVKELRDPRAVDYLREGGVTSMLSHPHTTWLMGINNLANFTNLFTRYGLKYPMMAAMDTAWWGASLGRHQRVLTFGDIASGWRAATTRQNVGTAVRTANEIMSRGYQGDAVLDAARIGELDRVHREYFTEKFGRAGAFLHAISTRPLMASDAFTGTLIYELDLTIQMAQRARLQGRSVSEIRAALNQRDNFQMIVNSRRARDYTLVKRKYESSPMRMLFAQLNKLDRRSPMRQAIEAFAFHILPFSTVAENVAKQGMYDFGVAGVPGQLIEIGRGRRFGAKDPLDTMGKLDLASNVVIGASLATLGFALMQGDLIAPSGIIDREERKRWAPGKKPGHVNVNGTWVDIRGMPFAIPLMQIANYHEALGYYLRKDREEGLEGPEHYARAVTMAMLHSGAVTLENHPMLAATTDFAKWVTGFTPKEYGFSREFMRYFPAEGMIRWMAGLGDAFERDRQTFIEGVMMSFPGARQQLPELLGPLGDPIPNDMAAWGGTLPENLGNAVTPAPRRSVERDEDILELHRLLDITFPEEPEEWQGVKLTREEAREMQQIRGQLYRQYDEVIFNAVQRMPYIEMKKRILENFSAQFTQAAGAYMMQRSPDFVDRYREAKVPK